MHKIRNVVLLSLFSSLAACGVRGRPQLPLTPPELGRGQPTYKRATEEFAFPNVPPVQSEPQNPSGSADERGKAK